MVTVKIGFRIPSGMDKFLKRLKETRYYTFMYMSIWKVTCLFITMVVVSFIEDGSTDLFDLFEATFSARDINITKVRTMPP
jgi:hypothetical protein